VCKAKEEFLQFSAIAATKVFRSRSLHNLGVSELAVSLPQDDINLGRAGSNRITGPVSNSGR
jgi:hypothetical protein